MSNGSLPSEVTHFSVPEASGPSIALLELDCFCFSLALITGNSNAEKYPKTTDLFPDKNVLTHFQTISSSNSFPYSFNSVSMDASFKQT